MSIYRGNKSLCGNYNRFLMIKKATCKNRQPNNNVIDFYFCASINALNAGGQLSSSIFSKSSLVRRLIVE